MRVWLAGACAQSGSGRLVIQDHQKRIWRTRRSSSPSRAAAPSTSAADSESSMGQLARGRSSSGAPPSPEQSLLKRSIVQPTLLQRRQNRQQTTETGRQHNQHTCSIQEHEKGRALGHETDRKQPVNMSLLPDKLLSGRLQMQMLITNRELRHKGACLPGRDVQHASLKLT